MTDIKSTWDEYYSNNDVTAIKDDSFFELEVNAIIDEIEGLKSEEMKILELGSGTGFLLNRVSDHLKGRSKISLRGIDFSKEAVEKANQRCIPDCQFIESDFIDFLSENKEDFDLIITQRSLMALLEEVDQNRLLGLMNHALSENGNVILSECIEESLDELNQLRKQLGVAAMEKVWHCRYLDRRQFEAVFKDVRMRDFSSLYYLITRVIYPYFEDPVHNSNLAKFASTLPQIGNFSFVKLITAAKK